MTRILVIDDEPNILASISFCLQKEAYEVLTATEGFEAISVFRKSKPDLVILDLMLGDVSGFEVCRTLRAESKVPVIILSAKDSDVDKVVSMELGADDYMTKPFSMHELLARVRARLRRGSVRTSERETMSAGGIKLDSSRREVIKDGAVIDLKPREFDLLAYLMKNTGRVLTRAQIMQSVWGYDLFDTTRTVDVHIGRLRGKLEDSPAQPKLILTMRGYGYCFTA